LKRSTLFCRQWPANATGNFDISKHCRLNLFHSFLCVVPQRSRIDGSNTCSKKKCNLKSILLSLKMISYRLIASEFQTSLESKGATQQEIRQQRNQVEILFAFCASAFFSTRSAAAAVDSSSSSEVLELTVSLEVSELFDPGSGSEGSSIAHSST